MLSNEKQLTTRRQFLKATGGVVAISALAGGELPLVHAAGEETIQLALVGCGGRGSGAVMDALSTTGGPVKLVAMADAYTDRLQSSHGHLREAAGDRIDVPEERRFVGFDAYKKAMDALKPGDVVILATPPAFRWVHFQYAIDKGLNVFMEKPVTVDGPTSKRMLKLAEAAKAKNLKVGVGLMSRHSRALQELHQRIGNGEIGDIVMMRGYRMQGLIGYFESLPKPADISELDYQNRRFHSFLWASGGAFSDFYIHLIDHLCWMKNAWPTQAQGTGGRHYSQTADGTPYVDQNFDTYTVEYTFPDGSKFFFDGRCMNGTETRYSSYIHGTKGMAIASRFGDIGTPSAIYRGQKEDMANLLWRSRDTSNPYRNEWNVLMAAIRDGKPHNEVERGVQASLVTSMGRMAVHTGQPISYEEMLNCEHEFAPGLDRLTKNSPAPVQADAKGNYPKPQPGLKGKREY
ncbi:MAG: Gfo/Idh/MocA family oxidoreductase [Armatimonadetes bacterium]|nr:Gfo/Idh/MocA family oxidoreductase [Armatimonadota bacterium]